MTIKNPTPIQQLPLPPNPADRSTFNQRAYPWSEALGPWTDEANQLAADTKDNAQHAHDKAVEADGSAGAAASSALAASGSAGTASSAALTASSAKDTAVSAKDTAVGAKGDAETARDKAQQWATSTSVVEGGNKGAKGYALDAAQSAQEAADSSSGSIGPAIHLAGTKTPVDADELALSDSADDWVLKKVTWANLKKAIWAAFRLVANGPNAKDTLGLGTAAAMDAGTEPGELVTTEGLSNALQDSGVLASVSAEYTYNESGMVTKIATPDGDTAITYHETGSVDQITLPSGRVETYSYDNDGVLTGMTAGGV